MRKEQILILRESIKINDISDFCNKIVKQYPSHNFSKDFRSQVKKMVISAEKNGLSSKSDIYTFVVFKIIYDLSVEKMPMFKEITSSRKKSATYMIEFVSNIEPSFWEKNLSKLSNKSNI